MERCNPLLQIVDFVRHFELTLCQFGLCNHTGIQPTAQPAFAVANLAGVLGRSGIQHQMNCRVDLLGLIYEPKVR